MLEDVYKTVEVTGTSVDLTKAIETALTKANETLRTSTGLSWWRSAATSPTA